MLYVKDVTCLKDQQNRPLMTLIGTLKLQSRRSSREERQPISLLMHSAPGGQLACVLLLNSVEVLSVSYS